MSQYVEAASPLSDVTARIIAAATEVHRALGPGFQEVIYQRALARELPAHQLEFSREVWMDVHYKGEWVGSKRVDFVIDEVMVEIKAKALLEEGRSPMTALVCSSLMEPSLTARSISSMSRQQTPRPGSPRRAT